MVDSCRHRGGNGVCLGWLIAVAVALALAGGASASTHKPASAAKTPAHTKKASRAATIPHRAPAGTLVRQEATSEQAHEGARANTSGLVRLATADDDADADAEAANVARYTPRPKQPWKAGKPVELRMQRAHSSNVDLRTLPMVPPRRKFRPERELEPHPGFAVPPAAEGQSAAAGAGSMESLAPPMPSAPAPAPDITFDGLDFATWGAGHPPDTNGDVGPTYYIQTVNTAIGIYDKSNGNQVAAFSFDTFMSQGNFGNLCDTDNFGDPVVLYDSFEDRWVISDFAFQLNAGNVVNPPGNFQCIAVSKTGDPVSGGWNFYSINTTGGLGDYPKLGIWPDGIYMSVNMFDYAATGSFQNPRVYAFNKAQMYAGAATVQVVSFDAPSAEFTLLPSNARLQAGTPPAGTPNYFGVVWQFLDTISYYKFHVDWDSISLSTFTGPFDSSDSNWWVQMTSTTIGGRAQFVGHTPANRLDTLYPRLMVQNQYTNIGGVESLWAGHTVGAGNPGAVNAPTVLQPALRFYQVKVTGGTVEAAPTQAWTYSPDATTDRYMPSVAVDRAGDMAIGYTTSNTTTNPGIKYAGQLAGDSNTITQDEQTLFQGTGTQVGTCGGECIRWGDYSAMTLDPDGCTFWFTSEYYASPNSLNDLTRIGSFAFPSCTPVGNGGTVSGTVTETPGGAPIVGATVALGSRTTTTDGSGSYSFTGIPAGTYPSITASADGYASVTFGNIVVNDAATTTKNFSLATASFTGCLTDTTQADFLSGVPASVDLATSPGDVRLADPDVIDQQNSSVTNSGAAFSSTAWFGQTFTPSVTGVATRVDVDLFCFSCTGSPPNLVVSIRNAAGDLPTGADLASGTVAFNTSGAGGFFSVPMTVPPTLTAGVQYAIVVRMAGAYATGTPAFIVSSAVNPYAGGRLVNSTNSGGTWGVGTVSGVNLTNRDAGFRVLMNTGFAASGTLISGLKDANPAPGHTPQWQTLAWTATTPANTAVKFQVAASNSPFGPFNYVGPDSTAGTFFTTTGASLAQFNGNRYLRYKAILTTTDGAVTPTLSDVTVCFTDIGQADIEVTNTDGQLTATPGGSAIYTVTVTNNGPHAAPAATITDNVPADCTAFSYTSVAAGGATGNIGSGTGSIADTLNMPAGSSVTYTATCTVSTNTWGVINVATVTGGLGTSDLVGGNDSATDVDSVGAGKFDNGYETGDTPWSFQPF